MFLLKNGRQVDAISEAYNKAQKNEKIPKDLLQKWGFHDSDVATCELNRDLIIRMDEENVYTGYNKIIFHDAKIIKQEKPMEGSCWLYDELYRNEDGYEAHILFWGEGFYDLDQMNEVIISCKDITLDKE